jgi:hypothetical protein
LHPKAVNIPVGGGAGSPLPAAPNTPDGAHGLSRHSHATAEVTRPA